MNTSVLWRILLLTLFSLTLASFQVSSSPGWISNSTPLFIHSFNNANLISFDGKMFLIEHGFAVNFNTTDLSNLSFVTHVESLDHLLAWIK